MSLGVKETKELAEFLAAMGTSIGESMEDGWSFLDVSNFIKPLSKLIPAFSGIGLVDDELADMDQDEYNEIFEVIKTEFDLEDDQTEAIIERGIFLTGQFLQFIYQTFLEKEAE